MIGRKLPELKRAEVAFHHLCGTTNDTVAPAPCNIKLELKDEVAVTEVPMIGLFCFVLFVCYSTRLLSGVYCS